MGAGQVEKGSNCTSPIPTKKGGGEEKKGIFFLKKPFFWRNKRGKSITIPERRNSKSWGSAWSWRCQILWCHIIVSFILPVSHDKNIPKPRTHKRGKKQVVSGSLLTRSQTGSKPHWEEIIPSRDAKASANKPTNRRVDHSPELD